MLLTPVNFFLKIAIPIHHTILAIKDNNNELLVSILKYYFLVSLIMAVEYLFSFVFER